MAKIISFEKGIGKVKNNITDVECIYNVDILKGEKFVAFSTFGSRGRKDSGKASQVLHINKESAKEIVEILKQEFGL